MQQVADQCHPSISASVVVDRLTMSTELFTFHQIKSKPNGWGFNCSCRHCITQVCVYPCFFSQTFIWNIQSFVVLLQK